MARHTGMAIEHCSCRYYRRCWLLLLLPCLLRAGAYPNRDNAHPACTRQRDAGLDATAPVLCHAPPFGLTGLGLASCSPFSLYLCAHTATANSNKNCSTSSCLSLRLSQHRRKSRPWHTCHTNCWTRPFRASSGLGRAPFPTFAPRGPTVAAAQYSAPARQVASLTAHKRA
jgi:hypothetical protein